MKNFIIKFSRLKLLLLLAFVCLACTIAVAEVGATLPIEPSVEKATEPSAEQATEPSEEQAAEPSVEQTAEPNVEKAAGPPVKLEGMATLPLKERMQKRISVEFRNTAIEDALMLMADQADVDIVTSPQVTGTVTVKLTNVPLKEALDNILAAHGYSYVEDRNMIRVASADEIQHVAERMVHRIYRITYADVKEVESALKRFISKQGSLSSSPGTSNIIVTDTESQIKAMDEFVEEVDRITPQILVEARIYDVTSTEGFDIEAAWHMGSNTPITDITEKNTHDTSSGITNTITGTRTDTITSPKNYTETTTKYKWDPAAAAGAGGWVTDTDGSTRTVYDTPELYGYGITDTTQNSITNTIGDTGNVTKDKSRTWLKDTYSKSNPFVGGSFDTKTGGSIRLGFLDMVDVNLALNILHSQLGAKLLANPRILVLDNETAEFKIVSEIPYTQQSETTQGGSMTSIQFKDVGVELKVTPHLTRDGMVRLHIVPVFGVVSEKGQTTQSGVQTVPTVDTRTVDTKALIKDGQTVVIGGLRKREVTQDISKVPLLGDMPVLGHLFSSVSESVKTNELIIFITPRIIVEPSLSPGEGRGFEVTEFGGPKVIYTGDEKAEKSEK